MIWRNENGVIGLVALAVVVALVLFVALGYVAKVRNGEQVPLGERVNQQFFK